MQILKATSSPISWPNVELTVANAGANYLGFRPFFFFHILQLNLEEVYGQDDYMTHCLVHIGVGRIADFVSVGDNVCSGGSCADEAFSAREAM